MKRSKRIVAVLLCAVIAAGMILSSAGDRPVRAVTQDEIDELTDERSELRDRADEIRDLIDSLEYQQMTTLAKKEVLDEQSMLTAKEIENLTKTIAAYDTYIAEKEEQVIQAQAVEDDQWELYKTRIRAMEEGGIISYLSVIFQASSFSDLLSRLDVTARVMANDQKIYENLDAARKATIQAKEELEEVRLQQIANREEQEAKKAELDAQIVEAAELLKELSNNREEQQALLAELEAKDAELTDMIDELEEELWAQQQPGGGGGFIYGTGSIIWPCYETYVTSQFYYRLHPIFGYYTQHTGIDIACAYGDTIWSAASGTVILAQYYGGYGYCVMVSHGDGLTTLYGHLSVIEVSVGQYVEQGEVIAYSGASGNVTGPHLHFETIVDGERVDPLQFFEPWQYVLSPTSGG